MICHYCEQDKEALPFRCNYCGNYFCSEHRLPENHACPRVGGPKQPGYASVAPLGARHRNERANTQGFGGGRSRFRLRYPGVFSKVERKHIAAATVLMVAAGLAWDLSYALSSSFIFLLLLGGFAISFLGHELAHKFLAQRNGLWAEFRTNIYLLLLTAVSIIPFFFKFLVPGQTNIVGNGNKELMGAIALIGPGFNIALGILFYLSARLFSFSNFALAFMLLTGFNAWIALLNLLPFPGFDGVRAFEWDRTRWAIALVASIVLVGLTYIPI